MKIARLGGVIAAAMLAVSTPAIYSGADAAPTPTPVTSEFSATIGGPAVAPAKVTTASTATTSATKATCDAVVAKAKAEIASTGKSSQPGMCAFGSVVMDPTKAATPASGPITCPAADGGWHAREGNRRSACFGGVQLQWRVVRTDTGAQTGYGGLIANGQLYEPDEKFAQWFTDTGYALDQTVTNGTGFPTSITAATVPCMTTSAVRCQAGSTLTVVTPGRSWSAKGNEIVTVLGVKSFAAPTKDGWHVNVYGSGWGPVAYDLPFAQNRCDNFFTGSNCILPWVPGIFGIKTSAARSFALHVDQAMASGLPGRLDRPLSLHKSSAGETANRNKACPPTGYPRPTPTGFSCDEYPFAGTQEGAATTPYPGPARTQKQCQMPRDSQTATGLNGFSRCYIVARDNSSGGGQESAFFREQRIAEGDIFKVGFLIESSEAS